MRRGALRRRERAGPRRAGPLGDFDAYVAKAVKDWNVPGLAIAVVKDDSVVFAKGYGVEPDWSNDRVNVRALLREHIDDQSVHGARGRAARRRRQGSRRRAGERVPPWFQLYDPYVTREVTVRDLLTHRTGLPEADYLWYGTATSLKEIVRRLRIRQPETSFRTHRFTYENDT